MKKESYDMIDLIWSIVGSTTIGLLVGILIACLTLGGSNPQEEKSVEEIAAETIMNNPRLFIDGGFVSGVLRDAGYIKVTATVYNPEEGQCDADPLTTADGSKIDLAELEAGNIRWIAVSRDLLKEGNLHYGDVVEIVSNDSTINGRYEIRDTMNKRYREKIDILMPSGRRIGKWNVLIKKVEN